MAEMVMDSHGDSAGQQPDAVQQEIVRELKIEATFAAKLNLADFQNAVPMIRELSIASSLEQDSKALEIVLEAMPPFVKPRTWRLDSVGAGQTYRLRDLDVQLDGALFSRLTEAEKATVTVTLRQLQVETSSEPAVLTKTVELLPRNQWGGIAYMPDMVAAFVQPNEPAIDRLLKKAADVLRDHGKNTALDGYKGGPKRAWELVSAIWGAVVAMKLDYALPPASFEHTGQKVRSSGHIADSGLATCLDLALLFCSAIEQAGLNPILVFTRGHAFAGVWLRSEEFSTSVVDDVTALRKRVALKELALFETTLVTQRPPVGFRYATEYGVGQISEEKAESFELAVDIRRARLQRIKPLASTETQVSVSKDEPESSGEAPFEEPPEFPEEEGGIPDAVTLDPKDRLARWQRKLLDLSLRNNLLNFKAGKKALKLDAPDPGSLEDLVAEGKGIKLLPRPDLMEGTDPRDQAIHESREREDLRREHALDALRRREVFVGLPQEELDVRLVELYRAARTTLQEGGANTLFLALGFLNWTRDDKPDHKYRAPLILIPVALQRKSVRSGFTLTLHDDEPRFNPTLIEMLRQDFNLELGIKEGELDRDESGLDISKIWRTVSVAIKDIKGWEVSEDVVLSMFSFAKYLMWVDLVQRTDQLKLNPVVKHLIDTPRDPYAGYTGFPNPESLDRDFGPEHTFCPLPADSSQLSAVMAATRGNDFVLIGPPGTGKSQTISNLIAQCLAERKRVLFVSEKIAALDVVYRRLREVKLGEFCLELHSSKARKLDVLAQLKTAWEAQGTIDAEAWKAEAERLKTLRGQLNGYVERLHHRHFNGYSIYKAIGIVVDNNDVPALELSWLSYATHGVKDMDLLKEVADCLEVNAVAVGQQALTSGPLSPIRYADWSPTWRKALIDAARAVIPVAEDVRSTAAVLLEVLGLPECALTKRPRAALAALSRALPQAAGKDWRFVFRANAKTISERLQSGLELLEAHGVLTKQLSDGWTPAVAGNVEMALDLLAQRRAIQDALSPPWVYDVQDGLRKGIELLERIGELEKQLSVRYTESIEQLNVYQLQREYTKAGQSFWPISWLGKRKVRRTLEALVAGQREPDVASDLTVLVGIRDTRSEVEKLDIGSEAAEVWHGLKSKPEYLRAALKLQETLKAARERAAWSDEGLDLLASGRAGENLALEARKLRKLVELDQALNAFGSLESQTEGLWKGLDTDAPALDAALRFARKLEAIRPCGCLDEDIPEIVRGICGERFSKDHATLCRRASIEGRLRDLSELRDTTGGLWRELETDIQEIGHAVGFQRTMATAIANLATEPSDLSTVVSALERLVVDGNALLDPDGRVAAAGRKYVEAWLKLQPAVDRLAQQGDFSEQGHNDFSESDIVDLLDRCHAIVQSEARLNAWCAWMKVRRQAASLGLGPLIEGMENGKIGRGGIRRAFETNYCRWWLNAVVDNEPVIRTFVSAEHEKRIADFRHLDEKFTELTRAWVRAGLCSGLPSQDDVKRNSEWGILRREIAKKRAHLPLRELIGAIPSALTKLTPCLLMSPLSIAQYLAPDTEQFDVVVFDEASQIAVWDAIGAIARGKQVVMVGDPKQLPPTSFFDRAESSLDDEDIEGELESILDECLGANLPTLNLSWHYRSRNESLIAFSNHRYYGGGLVTFPSPVTEDQAVSFHYANGVYEKGGARINKPEARALVADIVSRLKSPGFRDSAIPRCTIGVVTFNMEQQKLIEDLLDEERRKDPSLEPYFSEAELEPLFVKNLENVQGDERDIMYFSITYGPDASGAVSMNFGPLNREGGERRLNVAITRARQELRVFSSIRSERMDLSRTQALGVRDLKHFLEFAERGPRVLAEATRGSLGDFESPFEEAVADALATRGWILHTQVGASSFRIDLAVVHPDAPGTYLTGIECDGATYHRSATARDRDKLREQVLRGLGWEILRVWSTDWWVDRSGTLDRLDQQLKTFLESNRAKRVLAAEREVEKQAAKQAAEAAIAKASGEAAGERSVTHMHAQESYVRDVASYPDRQNSHRPTFVEANLTHLSASAKPDAFFEQSYEQVLAEMISHIVATEGPVQDAVLARHISRAHGWQRTGRRIMERVEEVARKHCRSSEEEVGTFYWPEHLVPRSSVPWRPPAHDQQRAIDEVCAEELRSLAVLVFDSSRGEEWSLVQMARALGIMRLSAAGRPRLEAAVRAISM